VHHWELRVVPERHLVEVTAAGPSADAGDAPSGSADSQRRTEITPEHLLYGVLRDAADPAGTGLSRRGRKHLSQMGRTLVDPNPAAAILAAQGLDPNRLSAELGVDTDPT
jgi:hypothetical protein